MTSILTPAVEKVDLPAGTLIAQAFPRLDYADAYRIRLRNGPHEVTKVTQAALRSAPRWAQWLMRLRDRLVGPLGLKTVPHSTHDFDNVILEPGHTIGLFKVLARSDDELLLGEDDLHLDFRLSVLVRSDGHANWAIASTIVRFNNWLGRGYFLPVRPLHRIIVPAMLRNALRVYEQEEP
jgi:hypothetical protein